MVGPRVAGSFHWLGTAPIYVYLSDCVCVRVILVRHIVAPCRWTETYVSRRLACLFAEPLRQLSSKFITHWSTPKCCAISWAWVHFLFYY